MSIAVGDKLPAATFKTITATGPGDLSSAELFGAGKVAMFAVPGAYTPTCNNKHLPSFIDNMAALKAKGVDRVVCIAVNDPFVLKAWGEATGATAAGVIMAGDPTAAFVKAIGLDFDGSGAGLGVRAKRFSMLVEDGVVLALNVEDSPGQAESTVAEVLLTQI